MKRFVKVLSGLLCLILAGSVCVSESSESMKYITDYKEEFRSQYHFSPASGWIGDPDGYVHYQGKYHLFWWGKATSEDLVHFDQQTIGDTFATISDPGLRDYYTGSAVVDINNTAGFGENSLVAIYTIPTNPQKQSISYSTDNTFNTLYYYASNPVLEHENLDEFRDPTVFWDEENGHWTMVIALPTERSVAFYSSLDLKTWTYMSEFGKMGAQSNSWECPDLFRLKADDGKEKWVLVVSVNPNLEQYFVGEFDGVRFTPDQEVIDYLESDPEHAFWVDYGPDFYASRTFRDYDQTLDQTYWLGWMGNWTYNGNLPTIKVPGYNAQTGVLSVTRTLHLEKIDGMYRLVQRPIDELKTLRNEETALSGYTLPQGAHALSGFTPASNVYELDVTFTPGAEDCEFGLNLLVGNGNSLPIRYHTATQSLSVDRTNCADKYISGFSCSMSADAPLQDGKLNLHIYVDKKSVEIFVNGGERVITALTFPAENQIGIETYSSDSKTRMSFNAWTLDSIWPGHIQSKPVTLDDTDENIIYSGEWTFQEKKFMYLNKNFHETANGSLSLAFDGTAIDWYTGVGKDFGIVDIYIDGQLDFAGLDLYSLQQGRRKVYSKTGLSPGVHTITIQTTGRKNESSAGTKFAHDCFVYLPIR